MYGVVKGLYNCQQGRVEDINKRIYDRNLPNTQPQMCFSPRPVPTQCTIMPIMDQVAKANVPIKLTAPFQYANQFLTRRFSTMVWVQEQRRDGVQFVQYVLRTTGLSAGLLHSGQPERAL